MSRPASDAEARQLSAQVFKTRRWLLELQASAPAEARQFRTRILDRLEEDTGASAEDAREVLSGPDHPHRQDMLVRLLSYLIQEHIRVSRQDERMEETVNA